MPRKPAPCSNGCGNFVQVGSKSSGTPTCRPCRSRDAVRQTVDCSGGCGRSVVKSRESADHPKCLDCRRRDRDFTGATKDFTNPLPTCEFCGSEFVRVHHQRNPQRFCSRECFTWSSWSGKFTEVPWRECDECGQTFISRRTGRGGWVPSYCSDECALQHRSDREKAREKAREYQRLLHGYNPAYSLPDRSCDECGNSFVPASVRGRFCSQKCMKRTHRRDRRHIRRAVERSGDSISTLVLGERDEWVCGICHGTVDRTKPHNDDGEATIDHVIPVSLGGMHTWDNVQLAHRKCNWLKCDDPDFDRDFRELTEILDDAGFQIDFANTQLGADRYETVAVIVERYRAHQERTAVTSTNTPKVDMCTTVMVHLDGQRDS